MQESLAMKLAQELNKHWSCVDPFGNEVPFTECDTWLEQMSHIPESNLAKMLETDFDEPTLKDISDVYYVWMQKDLFSFEPYIEDDDLPTLVLSYDQYVQFPYCSFFSISSTPYNGSFDAIGSIDVTALTCYTTVCAGKPMTNALKLLFWAAAIDGGFSSREFRDCFKNNSALLGTWLTAALHKKDIKLSCDISDIRKYVHIETKRPEFLLKADKYAIKNKNGVYGILYKNDWLFACETRIGFHPVYTILDVTPLRKELDMMKGDFSLVELLMTTVLNLSGIHSQWRFWSIFDNISLIEVPNFKDVKVVSSLAEIEC